MNSIHTPVPGRSEELSPAPNAARTNAHPPPVISFGSTSFLDFRSLLPIQSILIAFSLFLLLAAPAMAQDSTILAFIPAYDSEDGTTLWGDKCFTQGQAYLTSFSIITRLPAKTPESFHLKWTAQKNGNWRNINKSNKPLAGNAIVKNTFTSGGPYTIWGITGIGRADKGKDMKVPAGQPMKFRIRSVYSDEKGPWSETVVNGADWMKQWGYELC